MVDKRSTVRYYGRRSFSVVFLSRGVPKLAKLRALTRVGTVGPSIPIIVIAGDRRRDVVGRTVNGGVTSCLVGPIGPGRLLLSVGGGIRGGMVVSRAAAINCRRRFKHVNVRVGSSLAASS